MNFGTRTSVRISLGASAVVKKSAKNSSAGTRRVPSIPRRTISVSMANAGAGRSPAGSAWASDPPNVPRWRTCGSATVSVARASRAACSAISGSRCTSWCVVIAPITRASPSSRTPRNSPMFVRSMTVVGAAIRNRSTGSRLWPPARILASSPASARARTASSAVDGAT